MNCVLIRWCIKIVSRFPILDKVVQRQSDVFVEIPDEVKFSCLGFSALIVPTGRISRSTVGCMTSVKDSNTNE